MKEPMSLKDVGRYYKDGKVKETEGGFWLKSDGLIFVVPKEVYLMQNGDILDPMYKYADLDGKLAEWLAEYAQGAEIHYRLGWFERVGDKAYFCLPDNLEAGETVRDIWIEMVWSEYESGPMDRLTPYSEAVRMEAYGAKSFTEEEDPYGVWRRRTLVVPIESEALESIKTRRLKQWERRIKKADEQLRLFQEQKESYERRFRELAHELETDKRSICFMDEEMIVKQKISPLESLILRCRYDQVGEQMLLRKFPFLNL